MKDIKDIKDIQIDELQKICKARLLLIEALTDTCEAYASMMHIHLNDSERLMVNTIDTLDRLTVLEEELSGEVVFTQDQITLKVRQLIDILKFGMRSEPTPEVN